MRIFGDIKWPVVVDEDAGNLAPQTIKLKVSKCPLRLLLEALGLKSGRLSLEGGNVGRHRIDHREMYV